MHFDFSFLYSCIIATFLAFLEFFIGTRNQAKELGTTWWNEIVEEMKFALQVTIKYNFINKFCTHVVFLVLRQHQGSPEARGQELQLLVVFFFFFQQL